MKPMLVAGRTAWSAALVLVLICSGCATTTDTPPPRAPVRVAKGSTAPENKAEPSFKGEPSFNAGVASYDNGDYKAAERDIQLALDVGLDSKKQAKARKYLAFINCALARPQPCREQFRKAFEADPAFELEPAEAGHPMWGPVYRSVKAEMSTKPRPR
jgi:Tfp pilus assembly protein PilF